MLKNHMDTIIFGIIAIGAASILYPTILIVVVVIAALVAAGLFIYSQQKYADIPAIGKPARSDMEITE
jgi:regulator of protease activity HflC (stomatin/prohibitin superfamily)